MLTYKDMRNEMGMTQAQLGEHLNKTKSYVSLVENYKRKMSLVDFVPFYNLYVEKTGKSPNVITDIRHC